MTYLRKLAFYAAWMCLVLGHRLADYAKEGVGDADEYKAGGTSSDD